MQITSFILKVVAIISMLIDHTTEALYNVIPGEWWGLYDLGRIIGRTAFPLFCFMIVEGYYHTRNKWRYLGSLALLAFISELPFDSMFSRTDFRFEYSYQNVFFTLVMGLFAIILVDGINKNVKNIVLSIILQITIILPIMFAGLEISSDYGVIGVILIMTIYYFEKLQVLFLRFSENFASERIRFIFAGIAVFIWLVGYDLFSGRIIETFGLPAVILIMLYNGKRGEYKIPKYVFYLFYPLHLILLYFMRKVLEG